MREGTLKELNVKVGDKIRVHKVGSERIKGTWLKVTSVDHERGSYLANYWGNPEWLEGKNCVDWVITPHYIYQLEGEAVTGELKVGDEVLFDDGLESILCKVLATQNYWVVINYQGGRPWVAHKTEVSKPKPKPVVTEVVMYTGEPCGPWGYTADNCLKGRTHKITFNLVDGEPDCNSIKMVKL